MTDDTSGYITTEYEGIQSDFTEIEALPSSGICDLFKAKRYGRWYLLKCLKATHAADAAYQQMLRKEFEISITLQHPSVMQVMGIEEVTLPERGIALCIVAEWIDGRTLTTYIGENPSQQERRRILCELAEGVAYIHSQQVVHRDLKPTNIMVTNNGDYVKIIDFGLADTNSHAILKQPAGTLRYMPPEQLQRSVADVRNDIYSIGIIMQEMGLKGRNYRRISSRCLLPIEQRYQQMDELLSDLRSRSRQHLLWSIAALLVAGIIGILVWQVSHLRRQTVEMARNAAEQQLQLRILNHEIIGFADPAVKRKCVATWDTDHDGELSYAEAAAVDSLGHVFTGDTDIRSFDELEHFSALIDIGPEAFRNCVHLQSVHIPQRVRFIRHDAFRNTALEWFTFPGTVAGIGDHILEDCPNLHTIICESRLPMTNMTPESKPFVNCPRLSTIFVTKTEMVNLLEGKKLKEGEKNIETVDQILYGQRYNRWEQWNSVFSLMTTHIHFSDPEVKRICVAWWDRDGDHELSIQEAARVETLGSAFIANNEIETFDELRFFIGIQRINNNAFEDCFHLKSIMLPSSIKQIDDWAFNECVSLQYINFPRQVETIGHHAFESCNLQEIFIPESVTSLFPTSFAGNRQLSKVVVSPNNPIYDSRDNCNAIIETATNKMIMGSVTAFFPRSVDKMSDEAFTSFHRDTLTIPRQVKAFGLWSFTSVIDTIYCESPIPPAFNSQNGETRIFPYDLEKFYPVIYVPKGSREAYIHAEGWDVLAPCIREY